MQPRKNNIPLFLFLTAYFFIVICPAIAETGTYQIQPQQQRTVSLSLNNGDSVTGSIVVNGEGSIDFWISDSQGMNVTYYNNIGQTEFSLNAQTSGTFTFHILNRSTDSSVTATLNYNATHRIFGIPQEMFLLLVVVGIVLLLIIVWAVLSKL
jgi:uncharacterized membrane protein YdbT with pleckstrin-like domain